MHHWILVFQYYICIPLHREIILSAENVQHGHTVHIHIGIINIDSTMNIGHRHMFQPHIAIIYIHPTHNI